MALLEVERLGIETRRDGAVLPLVHDATFSVERGEVVALVGESGSGKSLTALATMGLLGEGLAVNAGQIVFEGRKLTGLAPDEMNALRGRDIAMIFQEPMTSLNPVRSIGRQLTEHMRLKLGLSRAAARARALDLLREVGISDPAERLDQYPHQLSGGMRQRVMIAIALACEPKLILADEPTTALDVTIQAQILVLLNRLCHEHDVGLVLITHNLGIVARHAHRVAVMYAGRVVERAPAGPLFARPRHAYTRGLLTSIPRLDRPRHLPLVPIPGAPPDPADPLSGCRFHPRCPRAIEKCRADIPPMTADTSAHVFACWNPEPAPPVQEVAA